MGSNGFIGNNGFIPTASKIKDLGIPVIFLTVATG